MPRRFFGFVLAGLLLCAGPALAAGEEYEIDPEHFSVAFQIQHAGLADIMGLFTEAEGSFVFNEEALTVSDIRIEIAADSVFTAHKKRDRHLRSGDFLSAKEFPKITFVGTGASKTGPKTGEITGGLTLRGVTKPVTLWVEWVAAGPYMFSSRQYRIGINARTTLKRSDFGMTYMVEQNGVGDEVTLMLGFEAVRQ